jgi:hypothetical protein
MHCNIIASVLSNSILNPGTIKTPLVAITLADAEHALFNHSDVLTSPPAAPIPSPE